jgi:Na+-translocating ferredoxin:NAD+ oxidoreductase RnfA subunit
MTELGLILFGALLVNNFVLAQFLGLCPFMGITRSVDTAFATGLATTFVLALAAVTSHTLYHYLLVPLNLTYLNIIVFIIVIAGLVQVIQLYLKATSPVLHQVLGVYLPLITSNCAVLGVTLAGHRSRADPARNLCVCRGRRRRVHSSHGAVWGVAGTACAVGLTRRLCRHAYCAAQRRFNEPRLYGLSGYR